jgi:hypothetical protein
MSASETFDQQANFSIQQPVQETVAAEPVHCGNCQQPLLGPHCYACGQPVRGMVQHFPTILADFFNAVFGLDSRIARTLGPLLLRPGLLSNEYFAGRRVRYVSPVQLFVFLCLIAFFAVQLSTDWSGASIFNDLGDKSSEAGRSRVEGSIGEATTVEEVERLRDQALAATGEIARDSAEIPGVSDAMSGVQQIVAQRARLRIEELERAQSAENSSRTDPAAGGDTLWKPQIDAPQIEGLPNGANAWVTRQLDRLANNIQRIQQDPNLFKNALIGAIPSTLFAMLPLFALLLRILYLFKRRLYMEHLIVALHSHAFLSLALLLAIAIAALRQWLGDTHALADTLLHWTLVALLAWMPLYLLLMQKRVYGQGWLMTLLKFCVIGFTYLMLLGYAAAFTALASLVWL